MGKVLEVLSKMTPKPLEGLWHKWMRVENCEHIHVHWRNLRILMTPIQFGEFVSCVSNAYGKWCEDAGSTGVKDQLLSQKYIPQAAPEGTVMAVEVVDRDMAPQPDWPDDHNPRFPKKIHLHYKDLRLEFEPDEFEQFKELIQAVDSAPCI